MIASILLMSVPAFTLGCVLTEVRWIVRMRRLQGQLSLRESPSDNESERLRFRASGDSEVESPAGFEDMPQSLRNLSQQLAEKAPVSPLPESLPTLKS
jgi:hypothetical protein